MRELKKSVSAVWLDSAERAELQKAADAAGIPLASYLRRAAKSFARLKDKTRLTY
jgi:hypothetical protein